MHDHPIAAGRSSYDLIDKAKLFSVFTPMPGQAVLDLACGIGNYSLPVAERVGAGGKVYGLDIWAEGVDTLQRRAGEMNLSNISAVVADAKYPFPLESKSLDWCLMATVFHDFVEISIEENVSREVARLLKPEGKLAIIEFKKIEGPPGPLLHIRLSREEVDDFLSPFGFQLEKTEDIGPYHYLSIYGGV